MFDTEVLYSDTLFFNFAIAQSDIEIKPITNTNKLKRVK